MEGQVSQILHSCITSDFTNKELKTTPRQSWRETFLLSCVLILDTQTKVEGDGSS